MQKPPSLIESVILSLSKDQFNGFRTTSGKQTIVNDMTSDLSLYTGKRVLVTGHTGFKGAWLCEWLLGLGAEVHGLALPALQPSLFFSLQLERRMKHAIQDIRDAHALDHAIREVQPDFIFHLAAQALVRASYREPVPTFATNALGTAHLLEAVRTAGLACTVVVVTTDKCYENDGRPHNFRESDPLGGHDPYSASKAAAEIIVGSYRDSFFAHSTEVALGSARAGNVVGGGDWAEDRLLPDCIRALSAGRPVPVRNPAFTRPWQHVLEPLGGYLALAQSLCLSAAHHGEPFNFGPRAEQTRTVVELLDDLAALWGLGSDVAAYEIIERRPFHEAGLLKLNCDKALFSLRWTPTLTYRESMTLTGEWYRAVLREAADARALTLGQIAQYESLAAERGLSWRQTLAQAAA
jgi:CDP-glucose 4,6-dehydratase